MIRMTKEPIPSAVAGEAACRLPSPEILPRRTLYLLLLFLCIVPYRGIVDNWLFNDDFSWLKAARFDMAPGNVLGFQVVEFFRPLVNLSFFAIEKASPGNIPLHYAVNIGLHFLCTLLVYHLVRNLFGQAKLAAAVAALFAVTSVHAAAIQWISARTTLLSAFFLLASMNLLVSRSGAYPLRLAGSIGLYVLALASKEEAICALFLVPFLAIVKGRDPARRGPGPGTTAAFTAVSAAYLIMRYGVMGGFLRDNWGPGAHAARNLGGGFIYQLYPWPIFSLFHPQGSYLPAPANPLAPEIVAIPLIAVILAAGWVARKSYAVNLASGWALLTLLPQSFFRYRFFSTESISQNRYYYVSSVGTTLLIVLFLSILWSERSRLRQAVAILVFVILCGGSLVRDVRLERKWDDFTRMYRGAVAAIVEECDKFPGITRLAVENPPLAFPYLGDALALERPAWNAIEIKGGRPEAERYAPCIYISYTGESVKRMRLEMIKGGSRAPAAGEAGGR